MATNTIKRMIITNYVVIKWPLPFELGKTVSAAPSRYRWFELIDNNTQRFGYYMLVFVPLQLPGCAETIDHKTSQAMERCAGTFQLLQNFR
jgi:hypothetical protein